MRFGIRLRWATVGTACAVAALLLCGGGLPARAVEGKIKVVASFSVLGDFVQQVGGDKIELRTLVPAGGDVHTFEPSPADSAALVDAALIFENGLQLETWLDDLYQSSGAAAKRIVVTATLKPLSMSTPEAPETKGTPGESDPHVWHDVRNAMVMVGVIQEALAEADAANAETYKTNADAYLKELESLDQFVTEQVKRIPEASRKLFTSHDAFGYFGARYGFSIDSALGITTETADPSAGRIATLIDKIRQSGATAIFAENAVNPALIEQIANEAGVKIGPPLFDVLGEPGSDGDTYVKMIRHNVTAIVEALSQ
jgi:ABC-type Zn uptake system ZnuABC Zn-binding protein ZnuA